MTDWPKDWLDRAKTCRWCEYFVPRAGMCVAPHAGLNDVPLRRRADDRCEHWWRWRPPSDGVKQLQTEDRVEAFPIPPVQEVPK